MRLTLGVSLGHPRDRGGLVHPGEDSTEEVTTVAFARVPSVCGTQLLTAG